MQGEFRFSFGPWNIHEGADPFGPEVRHTIAFNDKLELYKKLGFDIADYPNAYHMFENEITLPLNTKMTDEDLEYVIENFVEIVSKL